MLEKLCIKATIVKELDLVSGEQTSERRTLAQPNDRMGERNLAILASRQKELDFFCMEDQYRGFLAGLDEYYYQVCLSTDGTLILINREQVSAIIPTNKSISDLSNKSEIHKKIATFVVISEAFLGQ